MHQVCHAAAAAAAACALYRSIAVYISRPAEALNQYSVRMNVILRDVLQKHSRPKPCCRDKPTRRHATTRGITCNRSQLYRRITIAEVPSDFCDAVNDIICFLCTD